MRTSKAGSAAVALAVLAVAACGEKPETIPTVPPEATEQEGPVKTRPEVQDQTVPPDTGTSGTAASGGQSGSAGDEPSGGGGN